MTVQASWNYQWDCVVRNVAGSPVLTVDVKARPGANEAWARSYWKSVGPSIPGTSMLLVTSETTWWWPMGASLDDPPACMEPTADLMGKYLQDVRSPPVRSVLSLATGFWLQDAVDGVVRLDDPILSRIGPYNLRGGTVTWER